MTDKLYCYYADCQNVGAQASDESQVNCELCLARYDKEVDCGGCGDKYCLQCYGESSEGVKPIEPHENEFDEGVGEMISIIDGDFLASTEVTRQTSMDYYRALASHCLSCAHTIEQELRKSKSGLALKGA